MPGDISADGRYVVFASTGGDDTKIYRYDRLTGGLRNIVPHAREQYGGRSVTLSPDGNFVTFQRPGTDTRLGDIAAERSQCVSCWNGRGPATWTYAGDVSAEGRRVAFAAAGVYRPPRDRLLSGLARSCETRAPEPSRS